MNFKGIEIKYSICYIGIRKKKLAIKSMIVYNTLCVVWWIIDRIQNDIHYLKRVLPLLQAASSQLNKYKDYNRIRLEPGGYKKESRYR